MVFQNDKTPSGPTKFYIETSSAVLGPFVLKEAESYKSIFEGNLEAQGLWILRPGAREPFRISWRQALHQTPHYLGEPWRQTRTERTGRAS